MSGLAATRTTLKAVAEGASAGVLEFASAERVKLAYTQYEPTVQLLKDMLTDGPYLLILEGEKVEDINGEIQSPSQKRFRVLSRLYVAFDRTVDNDFTLIENFIEAICDAWRASSDLNVVDTNFGKPEINTERKPATAMYEIQAECFGC